MQFLSHKLIELPLISASSAGTGSAVEHLAAILNKLLTAYEKHKTTKDYLAAVHQTEEHQKVSRG